jgi:VWFA-related protein
VPARTAFIVLILGAMAVAASAQSGRVKPKETPSPTPERRIIYVPTNERPRVAEPTPTPPANGVDEEVITVRSTLVPIPVSVVDQSGQSVLDLRLEDFLLTIDGKRATIDELSRSESPIRLAMLFDNSSSVLVAREFEKKAAIRFFRRVLRPDRDMAALYAVSTVTRLEQPFTRDISALVRSIEMFPPPEGATALLDGIELAAEYLGEALGRRVIVIVSDGDDTKTDTTFEKALRKAQLWNCQIYVVRTTDFENYIRTRSRRGNANIRQLAAERRMLEFARQTGGAVYSPIDENELDAAFRRISAELSQQYILSYYPEEQPTTAGEFRTIDVAIPSRAGLTIRTRRGYYVPAK